MASHKIKDHLSDGWKYLFGQFIHSFYCSVTLTHTVILRFSFRMFEKDSVKRDKADIILKNGPLEQLAGDGLYCFHRLMDVFCQEGPGYEQRVRFPLQE